MSDRTEIRHHLISGTTIFFVLLAIAAWSSKPDEASFRRFAARQASQEADGVVEHVTARILSQVALEVVDWEYIDYGFVSVVTFPEYEVAYVGAFGSWHRADETNDKDD